MIRLCTAMTLLIQPIRPALSSVPYHVNPPRRPAARQANCAKKDAEIVELQKKLEAAAAELLAAQAALTEAYAERDAARLECSKLQAALNRYIYTNILVCAVYVSIYGPLIEFSRLDYLSSHILCRGVEYMTAVMHDCQCIPIYFRANDELAKLEAAVALLSAKSSTPSDEDVG